MYTKSGQPHFVCYQEKICNCCPDRCGKFPLCHGRQASQPNRIPKHCISVRASPPAAGPLSSRVGYIRSGLGSLGAALKHHGNVVQGWLTISKPYELREIVASGARMWRNFLGIWASGESSKSHGFLDADPADLRGVGATEGDSAYDDADDAMRMDPLGRSWGSLGPSWNPLGVVLGRVGAILGSLESLLGRLGSLWAALGALLSRLGALLGRLGALLSRLGVISGPSWDPLGPS